MRRRDDVVRSGGTNSTASPLPPGPVRMELAFTVGPGRGRMNLWKPTLDALGQILGHARPLAPGAPRRAAPRTSACTAASIPRWATICSSPSRSNTSPRQHRPA